MQRRGDKEGLWTEELGRRNNAEVGRAVTRRNIIHREIDWAIQKPNDISHRQVKKRRARP